MGDSLRYKDWFEKAVHDLRGAEILMEHDGGNDLVAFHCQQAMENLKRLAPDGNKRTPRGTQSCVSLQKSNFCRCSSKRKA